MKNHYDVIIIGGGPAGSTAGALLARGGLSVCLIEKETFPRFHIGESLLPACNDILRASGAWEKIERGGFVPKNGAEFTFGDGSKRVRIAFRNGLIPGVDFTWQVRRADFDHCLLNNAREQGCDVLQPARLTQATDTGSGWQFVVDEADGSKRELESSWFLDAGGRGRFLGTRLKLEKRPMPLPPRVAVYSHFHGVKRRQGEEAGDITVVRVPGGWFWSIPLNATTTSVGRVCMASLLKDKDPAEAFHQTVEACPFMRDWMSESEPLGPFHVESDYSYIHQRFAGERWLLLGDAAGFIDPVFSSGVYLGLRSATRAAEAIINTPAGRGLTSAQQTRYTRAGLRSMHTMQQLVQSFYHPNDFSVFMHPKDKWNIVAAVNSVVAGHTDLNFPLWWRFQFFRLLCRINRVLPLSPRLDLSGN